jgi:hypothetical protein
MYHQVEVECILDDTLFNAFARLEIDSVFLLSSLKNNTEILKTSCIFSDLNKEQKRLKIYFKVWPRFLCYNQIEFDSISKSMMNKELMAIIYGHNGRFWNVPFCFDH